MAIAMTTLSAKIVIMSHQGKFSHEKSVRGAINKNGIANIFRYVFVLVIVRKIHSSMCNNLLNITFFQ